MTKLSTTNNELSCEHFANCSGCLIDKGLSYPPVFAKLVSFVNEIDPFLRVNLVSNKIHEWRIKAKLAVRGSASNPIIGLFRKDSHDVVDIPLCRVHHPLINESVKLLKSLIIKHRIEPYDEKNHKGYLRYVQFQVNEERGVLQVVLVVNSRQTSLSVEAFLEEFSSNRLFPSVWINYQTENTNTIFGKDWKLFKGEDFFELKICQTPFFFHPACFTQANIKTFEMIIEKIRASVLKNKKVIELFAGVGVIGLLLLDLLHDLKLFEINPYSKLSFEETMKFFDSNKRSKVAYETKDVRSYSEFTDASVVIVDPPRKGLSQDVVMSFNKAQNLEQLVYVSCGLDSFIRDAKNLIHSGWKLSCCEAFVLFPGTDHIETLGVFEKISKYKF